MTKPAIVADKLCGVRAVLLRNPGILKVGGGRKNPFSTTMRNITMETVIEAMDAQRKYLRSLFRNLRVM